MFGRAPLTSMVIVSLSDYIAAGNARVERVQFGDIDSACSSARAAVSVVVVPTQPIAAAANILGKPGGTSKLHSGHGSLPISIQTSSLSPLLSSPFELAQLDQLPAAYIDLGEAGRAAPCDAANPRSVRVTPMSEVCS